MREQRVARVGIELSCKVNEIWDRRAADAIASHARGCLSCESWERADHRERCCIQENAAVVDAKHAVQSIEAVDPVNAEQFMDIGKWSVSRCEGSVTRVPRISYIGRALLSCRITPINDCVRQRISARRGRGKCDE